MRKDNLSNHLLVMIITEVKLSFKPSTAVEDNYFIF